MLSSAQIRAKARQSLGGKFSAPTWSSALFALFIVSFLLSIVSIISEVLPYTTTNEALIAFFVWAERIVIIVATGPLTFGLVNYCLGVSRKEFPAKKYSELFDGFKSDFFDNIALCFLMGLFTFLWSLLLVIPGIIKGYAYSMAYYVKRDNPTLSSTEAITKSRNLMNGHKWRLFCLEFSFIGWDLLSILTLGILQLWLAPYKAFARAEFYRDLINDTKNADEKTDDKGEEEQQPKEDELTESFANEVVNEEKTSFISFE